MGYTPKDWTTGDPITESDLDHIETGIADLAADSGRLTSGITAGTGWTVSSQTRRKVGKVVNFSITATRTGSAITVDSVGNLSGSGLGVLPVGYRPDATTQFVAANGTRMVAGFVYTDGTISLEATTPGGNIATNDMIGACATFLVP